MGIMDNGEYLFVCLFACLFTVVAIVVFLTGEKVLKAVLYMAQGQGHL